MERAWPEIEAIRTNDQSGGTATITLFQRYISAKLELLFFSCSICAALDLAGKSSLMVCGPVIRSNCSMYCALYVLQQNGQLEHTHNNMYTLMIEEYYICYQKYTPLRYSDVNNNVYRPRLQDRLSSCVYI